MAGGMITTMDMPFGICTNHQYPIFWTGTIIPMQGTVFVKGIPAAVDMNLVITSCGHIGMLMANTAKVYTTSRRAPAGYTQVIGPGVMGQALPMINTVMAM